MDEKHLLMGVRSGSEKSFRELYERWVSRLYSFVYRYVKSEDVADDIVQETFLRLWTDYVEYLSQLNISGEYIERHIDFGRFQEELAKAKAKLTPRQREIFELNKEQGISVSDIARQLSISEQVVRNQLSASLKVMRVELQRYACLLSFLFLLNG